MVWNGRMETKSPVRSGRCGPSARWACAIFSTIVCGISGTPVASRSTCGQPSDVASLMRFLLCEHGLAALLAFAAQLRLAVGLSRTSPCERRPPSGHQFAYRPDSLQVPDRFLHSLLRAVGQHAFGERRKLFFHFLIRQRIARITFGIVKLFVEAASVCSCRCARSPSVVLEILFRSPGSATTSTFCSCARIVGSMIFSMVNCAGVTWRSTSAAAIT